MANQEQLDILRQGVQKWNIWRKAHPDIYINLVGADLVGEDLVGINFRNAILREATLSGARLIDADLVGATLREATLSGADLSGARLVDATLSDAILSGARLVDAILNGANLSNADLSTADLSTADLSNADLSTADLSSARLVDTYLADAYLVNATLRGATLNGANLIDADLSGANLSGATLNGVNLSGTILNRADLSGATLNEAIVENTVWGNVDLRMVKGLETVQHDGPSIIGTSTLERSQGDIPEVFLRGAGLSDTFIEYARTLVQKPIDYYTCFISYSINDEIFVKRLHSDLQSAGVRCWLAPKDIGDKIGQHNNESIKMYDKLLLVLSKHSIASTWVEYEVKRALKKEPEGQPHVLFLVRLDKTILTCEMDWAQDIKQTRPIGDFERWNKSQDAYQESFKLLLHALQSKSETNNVNLGIL